MDRRGPTSGEAPRPPVRDSALVVAVVAASAIAAAAAGTRPTGVTAIDVIESALFGATVTWFVSRAHAWTRILVAASATLLAASLWGLVAAALSLALGLSTFVRPSRHDRLLGAVTGALGIQVLLRARPVGGFGFTALVTGIVVVVVIVSGYRAAGASTRRRLRIGGLTLGAVMVLAATSLAVSLWRSTGDIDQGIRYAQNGVHHAEHANQFAAALSWFAGARHLHAAHGRVSSPFARISRVAPIVSQHAQLLETSTATGTELTFEATRATSHADLDKLRSADGSFDLDEIAAMRATTAHMIELTDRTITRLDGATSPWLVPPARRQVEQRRKTLTATRPRAERLEQILASVPTLLGAHGPKRYLVLFANPAESRGMGGFIGAWAQVDAVDGRLDLVRHGHIDDLNLATDWRTRSISGEPEYSERYVSLQPTRYLQNMSASPDFPTVARVATQLYAQSGGEHVDGVLYLDPIALGALLRLTGPIEVEGLPRKLTGRNVADFLMHTQYHSFGRQRDERLDALGDVADATFDALLDRDLPSLTEVMDTLGPMVAQRRLLLSVPDPAGERFLDSVGLTGCFPRSNGSDLLSVRISNASTNKIDYFLDFPTRYSVRYDPTTGATSAHVKIIFENHVPDKDEPAYIVGNPDSRVGRTDGQPSGSDHLQFRVYSALRPTGLTIDGHTVGVQVQHELGAWVSSQTVTVPARGKVTVDLQLTGQLEPADDYRLEVIPQAAARMQHTTVRVEPTTRDGAVVGHLVTKRRFDHEGIIRVVVPARSDQP